MKSVLITGANRGIGLGFTKYFLGKGFYVFAGMRDVKSLNLSHKNLVKVKLDISNDPSISEALDLIKASTDSLSYLINNAGMNKDSATNGNKQLVTKLSHLDRKSMLKLFDVNSVSPLLVTKAFLTLLKENPSFVVNISSDRASYHDEYENSDGNYGYRASKCALNMLTFCSLYDLPDNVKTFAVHPGGVKTDMNPTGEHDAYIQAEKIIDITNRWSDEFNGKFMRFDGTLYPL